MMIYGSFFIKSEFQEEALSVTSDILQLIDDEVESYELGISEKYWKDDSLFRVSFSLHVKCLSSKKINNILYKLGDKWEVNKVGAYASAQIMETKFKNVKLVFADLHFEY